MMYRVFQVLKQQQSVFLVCACLFVSNGALATEDMLVHQHELRLSGVLPVPYYSVELEIVLDPETDDADVFNLKIAGTPIQFSENDLSKLRDLELGTLSFMHGIHRTADSPAQPIDQYFYDYVIITVELGKRHRIEYDEDGQTRYHWGRDRAVIGVTLSEDKGATILIDPLAAPDGPSLTSVSE